MGTRRPNKFDVCIVGAGWSGLLACKYAIENHLSVVVLESRKSFGGVWNFSRNPDNVTVMRSTITSSSATVMEASDFYIKPEAGNFLRHEDVMEYLGDYISHFRLAPYLRFNRTVETVERAETWVIHTNRESFESRYLVLSTGVHQKARPFPDALKRFDGSLTHAGWIKSIDPGDYSEDDKVLVYGGGESASDVVERLAATKAEITWSIPDGQHFFRKANIFKSEKRETVGQFNSPLDEASSRIIQYVSPFAKSKPGFRWMCNLNSTGSAFNYLGHGIPEWRNDVPFMHALINKNGHVVEFVRNGRVRAAGTIVESNGNMVSFENGDQRRYTHIICCVGYDYDFPFLPEPFRHSKVEDCYKLVFNNEDPSLLYIGFARPTVGSIPLMTELQCQYAFGVISGKIELPGKKVMRQVAARELVERDTFFHYRRRPKTLVDPVIYGYDLAKFAGTMPRYLELFFTRPVTWFKTFFSPQSAVHLALMNRDKCKPATDQIWKRQKRFWFAAPFLYLVCRALQVDRVVDFISDIRYRRAIVTPQPKDSRSAGMRWPRARPRSPGPESGVVQTTR